MVRPSQPLDVEAVLVSCLAGHLAIILHAGELRPRVDVKFEEHPHDVIVKRENGSGRASARVPAHKVSVDVRRDECRWFGTRVANPAGARGATT